MADDPKVLTDEVRAAETAIRHWEQELADRVRDVSALDGFLLSAMTTLLGTREAKVEAAVARVAEVQARLAAARKVLASARQRLAAAEEAARSEADAETERIMDLELRADAIRATPHPAAAELERREAQGEAARIALAATMEALQAAMGALAATGTVLRAIDKATQATTADATGVPLAELWRARESIGLGRELESYRDKARRLQQALDAAGMAWAVGEGNAPFDFGGAFVDELAQLRSLEEQQARFDGVRLELRALLDGFEGERRSRAAEVERLEAERRRLLESAADPIR